MIFTHVCELRTKGQGDVKDVTGEVRSGITASGCRHGVVTVFVLGSTAGVTTIEFESGAIADFGRMFEAIAPRSADYRHHMRWGDDNGSSHVRAALLGPSVSIPVVDAKPALGTWQQVVVVEFDTQARTRRIIVQVIGEP